jgi:hypothetical protein
VRVLETAKDEMIAFDGAASITRIVANDNETNEQVNT